MIHFNQNYVPNEKIIYFITTIFYLDYGIRQTIEIFIIFTFTIQYDVKCNGISYEVPEIRRKKSDNTKENPLKHEEIKSNVWKFSKCPHQFEANNNGIDGSKIFCIFVILTFSRFDQKYNWKNPNQNLLQIFHH